MTPPADAQPDPGRIMALSTAFWDAQALLTANRLGVFETLSSAPMTASEVAEALQTAPRATQLLLNACAALELLQFDGERFTNSAATAAYLVPGQPGYLGNAIRYSDNLYPTWGQLQAAVTTDQPQLPTTDYTGADPDLTRDFVYGMHERALGIGRQLVELVDLGGRTRLLDVGGGPGTYSALFAQKYPQLRSVVLELPGVAAHAEQIIASLGVAGQVSTLPGDFHTTEFPADNDAVLISGVMHREPEAACRSLIERAAASLRPGGLLAISDVFTDAGGCSPAFAAMFGLNMLLTAQGGGVHADADMADWLRDAGFSVAPIESFPPPMPHRVIVGTLPTG